MYGPVYRDGIWRKRPTAELYKQTETITDNFWKSRARFYGHIYRMNDSRLTKKIFNIVNNSKMKTMKEAMEDLMKLNISEE